MRVGGRTRSHRPALTLSRENNGFAAVHSSPLPMGEGQNVEPSMKLGTPLSDTAVRVMLLGSGELGKEVAIELQRLGCEVIAVDRYPNAPAMQVAHRCHVIPMTDAQVLNGVILAEAPHIIVPEIEAIATEVLADIEAAGMARVVPTARAVQLTMNREGIRKLAAEDLGLPTSPYAFAGSAEELAAGAEAVGYPNFVKPVMSSSGKGQSFVESPRSDRRRLDLCPGRRPGRGRPRHRRGPDRLRFRDHPAGRALARR